MDDFVLGNIPVLFIGKGQIYLLKAFNSLKEKYPALRLMIVGGEREHEKDIADELYEYIDKANLGRIVKIVEPRDDINLIYNILTFLLCLR